MNQPVFSVIICVLNGAERLPRTLESLQQLDYPTDNYEIIVVDDGSTDDTVAVAKRFPGVRVVSHEHNQGHSAARNTGFREAKGTYVAYIDDDCIAGKQWLTELEKTLKEPGTLAAGGKIAAHSQKYISQRYLTRSGYGRPAPVQLGQAKTVWQRFTAYVRDKFTQAGNTSTESGPVCEVYGANAAFAREKLAAVKGFPTDLRSSEDAAICHRLRQHYPTQTIRFNAAARVTHDFTPTFGGYLHELFRRQADVITYYKHLRKTPPIFPFPVALLLVIAAAGLWAGWQAAILAAFVGPLLAYAWWPAAAVRRRVPEMAIYAHMQAIEETVRDAGLLVAGLRRFIRPYPHVLLSVALLAAGVAGVHWLDYAWLRLPVALLLLAVPGYLMIQALGVRHLFRAPFKRLAWMAMLGVAWNILIGLAVVWVLPLLGYNRPLEPQTLIPVYGIGLALLSVAAVSRRRTALPVRHARPTQLGILLWVLVLALPLASIVGASLLNRGGTSLVAVAAMAAGAALLAVVAWQSKRLPASLFPATLFSVSLAALLSYTTRSAFLFGWDIQQEFVVFNQTQATASWVVGQVHNPYDAMLSLTVFPSVLANIAGISGLAIFKLIFPLLFSFVPVLLYFVYRLWAKRWIAFVAAGVFIAQFYYFQEFAALARQQLAFLFFAGLLYLLLQQKLRGYRRVALGLLLIGGIVVSHYSSTYMAIGLLGGTFVLAKLFYLARRRSWIPVPARVVPLWSVVALIAGAILWYGPATHSSSATLSTGGPGKAKTSFMEMIKTTIQDKIENPRPAAPPVVSDNYFEQIAKEYHTTRPYMSYYPGASNQQLQTVAATVVPDRLPGLRQLSVLLDAALRYLWWIFGAIGIAWFARRAWKHFSYRDSEAAALVGMALVAFVAIHVIPSAGNYYNIPRLNQQALMFVALPAIAVLVWLTGKYLARLQRMLVIAPLVAAFLIASGVLAQAVGGRPTANLTNYGVDYRHFYIQPAEVAAARWLEQDRGKRQEVIYADRYANLRLIVPTTINGHIMQDITPETLAQHAYVYASQANTIDGVSMVGYKGDVVTFTFPQQFIREHKNGLYSNGYAEVYK